jgi:hypothetical protein
MPIANEGSFKIRSFIVFGLGNPLHQLVGASMRLRRFAMQAASGQTATIGDWRCAFHTIGPRSMKALAPTRLAAALLACGAVAALADTPSAQTQPLPAKETLSYGRDPLQTAGTRVELHGVPGA